MDRALIGLVIGAIVFALILLSSVWNSEDLRRFQELKNRRRFGGKRLSAGDQAEFDRLSRKYWWY